MCDSFHKSQKMGACHLIDERSTAYCTRFLHTKLFGPIVFTFRSCGGADFATERTIKFRWQPCAWHSHSNSLFWNSHFNPNIYILHFQHHIRWTVVSFSHKISYGNKSDWKKLKQWLKVTYVIWLAIVTVGLKTNEITMDRNAKQKRHQPAWLYKCLGVFNFYFVCLYLIVNGCETHAMMNFFWTSSTNNDECAICLFLGTHNDDADQFLSGKKNYHSKLKCF